MDFTYNGKFGFTRPDHMAENQAILLRGGWTLLRQIRGTKNTIIHALTINEWRLFSHVLKDIPITKKRLTYNTLWTHQHGSFEVYRDSRHNFDLALTRITKTRENENALWQASMRLLRRRSGFGKVFDDFLNFIRGHLDVILNTYKHVFDMIIAYANIPHAKRKLRLAALQEILAAAVLDGLFTEAVIVKFKMYERNKFGKRGRMIGDFTTAGSLLSGFLFEAIKKSILPYEKPGFYLEYVKSVEPSTLDRIGEMMLKDPRDCFFVFSDDILCKVFNPITNQVEIAEVDIESCDSGQSEAVPKHVVRICRSHPQFKDLAVKTLLQCKLPMKFTDPQSNFKFKLTPEYFTQSSGVTSTTVHNTLASAAIALRVWYDKRQGLFTTVRDSSRAVGYPVTYDIRTNLQSCTLLKNSWDINGESKLALGAIFKSFGSCYGDLPGSGDIATRAVPFMATVASGYIHSGHYHLIEHIANLTKKRIKLRTCDFNPHFKTKEYRSPATDDFYVRRYDLRGPELDQLKSCKYGYLEVFRIPAFRKIFAHDYGTYI
jgi:hypothetical protein